MNLKSTKVVIIGVGNVGATCAYTIVNMGLCDQLCLIEAALTSGTPVHRNGNDNTHSSPVFSELCCKRQTESAVGIAADTALQLYDSRRDILVIDKCGSEAVCALYREISGETGKLSRTLRAEELIIADEFTAYRTSCREKEVQYFLF